MYCGDETGAFIGDVGYSSCKFGYGGEDVPKLVFPSYASSSDGDVGQKKKITTAGIDYGPSHKPTLDLELVHVYEHPSSWNTTSTSSDECADEYLRCNGFIASWDAYEQTWEKAFADLHVRNRAKWTSSSKELQDSSRVELCCPHPICAIDQGFTSYNSLDENNNKNRQTDKQKEVMMELLFEKFSAPAVYIVPSPAVSAFSVGRPTSLVLDLGGGGCRATPMFDGLVLKTAQRRNGRGGEWLSQVQYRMLLDDVGITQGVCPRYAVGRSSIQQQASPSYHWNAISNIMYEMKTSAHVNVPSRQQQLPIITTEDNGTTSNDSSYYELPDGTRVDLGNHERLRKLPELLFLDHAAPVTAFATDRSTCNKILSDTCRNDLSLQKLIHDAISHVDVDLRKELCGNIILCGASSLFQGFEQRLSEELALKFPSMAKCRVICARPIERRFAAWIGASVLTSLGSFQQMWLSKAEYEEYGASLATKRFP